MLCVTYLKVGKGKETLLPFHSMCIYTFDVKAMKSFTHFFEEIPLPNKIHFSILFLSSQGETSIYSLPNNLVSNTEVKVISNSIFQNSVFWKTGLSDTYKWIISNIQRLKNAKSDSATKMWSNHLYQYVATYLVHSIVVKVALNNMLNTTVKRPNIPMTCLLQKSIYKLKGKLTWTNEHQTKKKKKILRGS